MRVLIGLLVTLALVLSVPVFASPPPDTGVSISGVCMYSGDHPSDMPSADIAAVAANQKENEAYLLHQIDLAKIAATANGPTAGNRQIKQHERNPLGAKLQVNLVGVSPLNRKT